MRNFINARLNKDNLFNVLFFLLFFMSLALGYIVPQPLGVILALVMFASAVILVKVGSPLTFDKEKMEFTTSLGKKTKNSGVGFIFLLLISFFLAGGAMTLIAELANIDSAIAIKLLFSFFFGAFPSLYCIIRNLPIAVYFKKEAWTSLELTGGSSSSSSASSHFQQSDRSIITDPSYRYLSCNVYHKR